MSDAEERAAENRQCQHEVFVECSNCRMDGPVRSMQDELPLSKPLCRKCRNAIPATVEELIDNQDDYIVKLEANRDKFQVMAGKMSESLGLFTGMCNNKEANDIFSEMQDLLEYQNKITKTLTRP